MPWLAYVRSAKKFHIRNFQTEEKKKNTNPKPHGQMDYWITHHSEEQDTALVKLISSNKGWKITNKVAKIQCFKETH